MTSIYINETRLEDRDALIMVEAGNLTSADYQEAVRLFPSLKSVTNSTMRGFIPRYHFTDRDEAMQFKLMFGGRR